MELRHEEKFEINFSDMLTVRQRLRCVAYPDPHAVNGVYRIRSLYFDSASDKALREEALSAPFLKHNEIVYFPVVFENDGESFSIINNAFNASSSE